MFLLIYVRVTVEGEGGVEGGRDRDGILPSGRLFLRCLDQAEAWGLKLPSGSPRQGDRRCCLLRCIGKKPDQSHSFWESNTGVPSCSLAAESQCLSLLPSSKWDYFDWLIDWYWVVWVPYIFWLLTPCWGAMACRYIFPAILSVAFLSCGLFAEGKRYSWRTLLVYLCFCFLCYWGLIQNVFIPVSWSISAVVSYSDHIVFESYIQVLNVFGICLCIWWTILVRFHPSVWGYPSRYGKDCPFTNAYS